MANRMILNETAWFGRAVDALTDEATRRGYHKALIVTDKTLAMRWSTKDKQNGCRRAGVRSMRA